MAENIDDNVAVRTLGRLTKALNDEKGRQAIATMCKKDVNDVDAKKAVDLLCELWKSEPEAPPPPPEGFTVE